MRDNNKSLKDSFDKVKLKNDFGIIGGMASCVVGEMLSAFGPENFHFFANGLIIAGGVAVVGFLAKNAFMNWVFKQVSEIKDEEAKSQIIPDNSHTPSSELGTGLFHDTARNHIEYLKEYIMEVNYPDAANDISSLDVILTLGEELPDDVFDIIATNAIDIVAKRAYEKACQECGIAR